jgi:hypothetical protein
MKKSKVILLSGQSNAVGVGHVKYLPKYFDEKTVSAFRNGYENVLIRYISHDIENEKFEAVRINQTEKNKDTLGPEVGIAKKLTEKYPHEQFFIIKCAFGGSDMHGGWRSPSSGVPYDPEMAVEPEKAIKDPAYRPAGWCYHEQIRVLDSGFAELKEMGYEIEVVAFCWMQGEADSASPQKADNYIFRYDSLLRDLRERYAPYFENCTYIDAGISEIWGNYEQMNARKKAYAEKNGYRFIDTVAAGFTTRNEPEENPDIAHYDLNCTVKLGELFAEEI